MISRRRVDLPQPLGPMRTVVFPGSNLRLIEESAAAESKRLLTPINSIMGARPCGPPAAGCFTAESNASLSSLPAIVGSVRAWYQILYAEPAALIGPMAGDLKARPGSQSTKLVQGVFVRMLGHDGLAFGKSKVVAIHGNGLPATA